MESYSIQSKHFRYIDGHYRNFVIADAVIVIHS